MFGVIFLNRSFPMDISSFSQIDTFHWILDMNTFVAFDQVPELCIFLLNNFTLPPDKALAVYIQSPGSAFFFCKAATVARPWAVLSLPWPYPSTSSPRDLPFSSAAPSPWLGRGRCFLFRGPSRLHAVPELCITNILRLH
ncbi:hypothetical protein FF1_029079 [Malus domestica]